MGIVLEEGGGSSERVSRLDIAIIFIPIVPETRN